MKIHRKTEAFVGERCNYDCIKLDMKSIFHIPQYISGHPKLGETFSVQNLIQEGKKSIQDVTSNFLGLCHRNKKKHPREEYILGPEMANNSHQILGKNLFYKYQIIHKLKLIIRKYWKVITICSTFLNVPLGYSYVLCFSLSFLVYSFAIMTTSHR